MELDKTMRNLHINVLEITRNAVLDVLFQGIQIVSAVHVPMQYPFHQPFKNMKPVMKDQKEI